MSEKLRAECPHCKGVIQYDPKRAGDTINCPVCREAVELPKKPLPTFPIHDPLPFPGGNVCIGLSVVLTLLAWGSGRFSGDNLLLAYAAFALFLLGLTLRVEAAIRDRT